MIKRFWKRAGVGAAVLTVILMFLLSCCIPPKIPYGVWKSYDPDITLRVGGYISEDSAFSLWGDGRDLVMNPNIDIKDVERKTGPTGTYNKGGDVREIVVDFTICGPHRLTIRDINTVIYYENEGWVDYIGNPYFTGRYKVKRKSKLYYYTIVYDGRYALDEKKTVIFELQEKLEREIVVEKGGGRSKPKQAAVAADIAVTYALDSAAAAALETETTLVDRRDGQTYKTVQIGSQRWMAENLNYDVPNDTVDACYNSNAANCREYGRYYQWTAAIGACPAGWHLPDEEEWMTLVDYVGDDETAGKKLRSKTGWVHWENKGNGTDEYGFSALPGGYGGYGGSIGSFFLKAGVEGRWWSATEVSDDRARSRHLHSLSEDIGRWQSDYKTKLFSVRCVYD